MPDKTNAARALDRLKIRYTLVGYEVDLADLSAETVARKIGLAEAQVLKTLVVRGERAGVFFAVVPAGRELDLKAAARAMSDKKVAPVALKEVEPLTGYVRGGVTALASKKGFPVVVDESALVFDVVSVSAGVRGTQILLAPADYVAATRAKVAPLSTTPT
ncbi:MAG: Cys-tRNA(Pro) deacylase [Myxococcales bacterium]|nr:Cys-tRNA(Pro) deacylase [Myxococcales bacterium]MBL0192985.1 Cys-tRNA(Pro) deacylase [Myxococcales bacterium]HQY59904.1 Cys-tRNA(Pro) deacylase [Polyangiaceae bacterium]